MVFAIFFGIKLLKNNKIKNIILFSLFCALATSIRSIGIFLLLLILGFIIIENLEAKIFTYKKIRIIFSISIFFFLFTCFFWPYLWLNPINGLITSLKTLGNDQYGWGGSNFYLGNYVKATNVPWHYSFVWIAITTPLIYSILFIFGSYKIIYDFFSNLDNLWKNLDEKIDLFILLFFFIPLLTVITLNSALYDGWRHLYFIYPALIYISVFGLKCLLNLKRNKFYINLTYSVVAISIFINIFNIVKLHPFQNIYFNILVEKKANNLFSIDYWGLANSHSIIKILNDMDDEKTASVRTASFTPLQFTKYIIDMKKLKNLHFSGTEGNNSDYIFTNYIYEGNPKYKKKYFIQKNYEKIFTLSRGNVVINEVFKKK
tara:strand:- start:686 stop:1807 length:1122 start_codon:yes stop_codon:yes gene_type:complete